MKLKQIILFVLLFCTIAGFAGDLKFLTFEIKSGDAVYVIFNRYKLNKSSCNIDYFKEINNLGDDMLLITGKTCKLPIIIYQYNGKSIRSTIGINNWDLAKTIQSYNEEMVTAGLKEKDYRQDNVLWVPYNLINCDDRSADINNPNTPKTIIVPVFGSSYEKVEITDFKLKGSVYYILSGHGGPDPGAMGKYDGHILCEDEYAYDISLRLARDLMEHGARVYIIVSDPNDGIRDGKILEPDKDETCYKDQEMPLNQIARLNQGCNAINALYEKNKKDGVTKQRVVTLHLDSRGQGQRVDMFFYYKPKSEKGKKLATTLMNTVEEKYNYHQKNRGYSGTVEPRNLHVLRKCRPVSVFIELGNIRNPLDQKRFIIDDNRQAVANWLADGLMNEN